MQLIDIPTKYLPTYMYFEKNVFKNRWMAMFCGHIRMKKIATLFWKHEELLKTNSHPAKEWSANA